MVIVDGETLVDTAIMAPGDMERISCIIPAGAQTLTMRTSDVEGDHYNDYCDWIEPTLYTGSPKVNGVKKALYSEGNLRATPRVSAEASIGVRFNSQGGLFRNFDCKESSEDKINGYLYDFTYSYVRSLQNKPLATVTGEPRAPRSNSTSAESSRPANMSLWPRVLRALRPTALSTAITISTEIPTRVSSTFR